MMLKLAERLNVPLRERNVLLAAAGFPQRLLDDPALKSVRAAIDLVLKAHEPNPALGGRPALEPGVGQPHDSAAVDRQCRDPLQDAPRRRLSFFSTIMVFGTPVDITLSELALETFFPADDLTAERMRKMAAELK